MSELIFHTLPVILALASFWSDTERKLLFLNLGLCITIAALLAFQQAWGGVLVITVAGISTTYRLITSKLVSSKITVVLIMMMSALIGIINNLSGKTGLLELMPLVTFIFYRFGELHCREAGLRMCMVIGSTVFTVYALITHTWGVAVTESLFAISNLWYWIRLRRTVHSTVV